MKVGKDGGSEETVQARVGGQFNQGKMEEVRRQFRQESVTVRLERRI